MGCRVAWLVLCLGCFPSTDPPPPEDFESCAPERRVGVALGHATCPQARGAWTGGPLFDDPSIRSRSGDALCAYEYVGRRFDLTGLPSLRVDLDGDGDLEELAGEEWTDADCSVAIPMDVRDVIAPSRRATFHRMSGRLEELPDAPMTPVTVAVLDSAPDQRRPSVELEAGDNPHGAVVGSVIADLACPGGEGCAAHLVSRQVLTNGDSRTGFLGDVARAIAASADAGVINLSIGWLPRFHATPEGDERGVVEALRAALDHAVCHGALTVAAAGNRGTLADDNSGMTFPAAFAAERAWHCPDALVTPVGTVDVDDTSPPNVTRDGGQPPLVALGVGVTTDAAGGASPTTGTSLSAATVSGIAAVLRAYAPELSNAELLARLVESGVGLGERSTACSDRRCAEQRRVDLCSALADVLADRCRSCEVECDPVPPGEGGVIDAPDARAFTPYLDESLPLIDLVATVVGEEPDCEDEVVYDPDDPPSAPCPSSTHDTVLANPGPPDIPTPGPGGCEVCALLYYPGYLDDVDWWLYVEVNPLVKVPVEGLELNVSGQSIDAYAHYDGPPLVGGGPGAFLPIPALNGKPTVSYPYLAFDVGDHAIYDTIQTF